MTKDEMPTIISVDELAEKTALKLEEKMKPKPKPDSLNEASGETYNYKAKLAEMIRDTNSNWKWTGTDENKASENRYFESIGGLSAGSAVPEIWAADVFRCCPYPASAFWDAPYVKWHDDIKGNLEKVSLSLALDQAILSMSLQLGKLFVEPLDALNQKVPLQP